MSSDVYVLGVGMTKFGRHPDVSLEALGAAAVFGALDDAGVTMDDVQAFYCGNVLSASANVGQLVARQIGQTGIPITNVVNACATGATAFREAWVGIKAGLYDVCLVLGVEKMGKGLLGNREPTTIHTEGLLGSELMPSLFSTPGNRHSELYGTTAEQFAKVSVKNHEHSTRNPLAMYRKETPLEEVLGSEMICYPNTKLMCSVNVDGSAAALLVSEKKARELGMKRAVKVRASALTSDPYQAENLASPDFSTCTRNAARQAYEQAGLGPEDLNLVELHDCFATAELLHYENLGLCAEGEAGALIDSSATAAGGRIPVNLSGGLLSKGHPLGATGVANIFEVVTHLRSEAGARQAEGARIGLTHVVGLGSCAAVHILEAPALRA